MAIYLTRATPGPAGIHEWRARMIKAGLLPTRPTRADMIRLLTRHGPHIPITAIAKRIDDALAQYELGHESDRR